jgi:hypothetical protein
MIDMATVTLSDVDEVIATTQKAVLVHFTHGQETWIPRSVCDGGDDLAKGDTDIVVQGWFANQEGLG